MRQNIYRNLFTLRVIFLSENILSGWLVLQITFGFILSKLISLYFFNLEVIHNNRIIEEFLQLLKLAFYF